MLIFHFTGSPVPGISIKTPRLQLWEDVTPWSWGYPAVCIGKAYESMDDLGVPSGNLT